MSITQVISPITSIPNRMTQSQQDFDAAATGFASQIVSMVSQINTWSGQANTLPGQVAALLDHQYQQGVGLAPMAGQTGKLLRAAAGPSTQWASLADMLITEFVAKSFRTANDIAFALPGVAVIQAGRGAIPGTSDHQVLYPTDFADSGWGMPKTINKTLVFTFPDSAGTTSPTGTIMELVSNNTAGFVVRAWRSDGVRRPIAFSYLSVGWATP